MRLNTYSITKSLKILLLLLTLGSFTNLANAESTNLSQSIVPLECYIDAVNAGNGSHLTIRPEDCYKEPTIPPIINNNNQKDQTNNPIDYKNVTFIPQPKEIKLSDMPNNQVSMNKPLVMDFVKREPAISAIIIISISLLTWSVITYFGLGRKKLK